MLELQWLPIPALLSAFDVDGAAVRAVMTELCARSVMPELLWRPIPEPLCILNAGKWTDYPTDRPANRPGIQGKHPVMHVQVVKQVSFPLLSFFGGCTLSPMSVVFP